MGLATTFVLVMANIAISLIKNLVPDKVRIPIYIVVVAAFVTVVDLVMAGYAPALHSQLGIFIPLIVVNCIVLGRAEAFASRNNIFSSMIDGLGMGGLGFAMALTILGSVRELIGNFSIFGYKFIQSDGILIFILSPGAFIALGFLIALINLITKKSLISNTFHYGIHYNDNKYSAGQQYCAGQLSRNLSLSWCFRKT